MAREVNEGLFKVLNNSNVSLWQKGFCKIAEAKVITSLLNSEHRYIAYTVKGWRNEPTEQDPSEPVLVNGESIFYARVPKAVYNVYQVDEVCRTHFLSEVIYLTAPENAKHAVLGLSQSPAKGLGYSFFAVNEKIPVVSAKRFWHVEHYESTGLAPITHSNSYSMAILANNTFNQCDVVYDTDFDWFKTHRSELVAPAVFSSQRMYVIEP